jgi:hypothetical protein
MPSQKTTIVLAALAGSAAAFTPLSSPPQSTDLRVVASLDLVIEKRPIYDPLGLYGESSQERQTGRIRALEPRIAVVKPVVDPLNLYPKQSVMDEVDENVDMSDSLPFLPRPAALTRELAGDVGFDPFNLSYSQEQLAWQREAELKHGRIAMLAAVGWPLSELFDKPLADLFHLEPLLTVGDRAPSVLNGGLGNINPLYWIEIICLASFVELIGVDRANREANKEWIISNDGWMYKKGGASTKNWDPLGLSSKLEQNRMELAEIKHGRLAMMAIVGFAIQEFVTKTAVVDQTHFFFHPLW